MGCIGCLGCGWPDCNLFVIYSPLALTGSNVAKPLFFYDYHSGIHAFPLSLPEVSLGYVGVSCLLSPGRTESTPTNVQAIGSAGTTLFFPGV